MGCGSAYPPIPLLSEANVSNSEENRIQFALFQLRRSSFMSFFDPEGSDKEKIQTQFLKDKIVVSSILEINLENLNQNLFKDYFFTFRSLGGNKKINYAHYQHFVYSRENNKIASSEEFLIKNELNPDFWIISLMDTVEKVDLVKRDKVFQSRFTHSFFVQFHLDTGEVESFSIIFYLNYKGGIQ